MDVQPGQKTVGPYPVLRKLGQGGMGVVYLVQDPQLDRQLALKLILDSEAREIAIERFWREAETLGRIHHRSIVRVHQVGQVPEGTYLLMELVEGETLEELLRRGPVEHREAVRIVRELTDAIAAVHAEGILHRDIKPGNVILKPDGIPVLLDFGLIRDASAERLTKTGTTLGTLAYMSPEQTGGESTTLLGPQTDVYSLGMVLFELLTGRRPFDEENTASLVAHRLYDEAPPPSSFDRSVSRDLDAISRVALARDPGSRYATAEALREDLDRVLAGRDPLARARLGVPRRARLIAVLLVMLLALGGVLALLTAGSGVSPEAIDGRASAIDAEARELLRGRQLLAAHAEPIAALAERLRSLERDLPADMVAGKNLRLARQRVVALEGLLAVTEGNLTTATAALQRLEEYDPPLPSTRALRGGVGAITTAADPDKVLRELASASSRGVAPAETLEWRARALLRSGLTDARAHEVLQHLDALARARRGSLASAQPALRIRALAQLKRAEEASAVLSELGEPSADLRWVVALTHAELLLEKDPGRALEVLAALPEQDALDPNRARLARRILEIARSDIRLVRSGGNAGAEKTEAVLLAEKRLLTLGALARRLQPAEPVPEPIVKALFDTVTRPVRYWSPTDVAKVSALLPDDPGMHMSMLKMNKTMAHKSERKKMFPMLYRALELQTDPDCRLEVEVGICVTLSQLGRPDEALAMASRLLDALEAPGPLRQDLLLVRSRILLERGQAEDALVSVDDALEYRGRGLWSPFGPLFHKARVLDALGRRSEAARSMCDYLATGAFTHPHLTQEGIIYVWVHGRLEFPDRVRRSLETFLAVHSAFTGWRARLGLLQLQMGRVREARASFLEVAAGFRASKPGLAKRAVAVARATAAGSADALSQAEALIERLDEQRGDGFEP